MKVLFGERSVCWTWLQRALGGGLSEIGRRFDILDVTGGMRDGF